MIPQVIRTLSILEILPVIVISLIKQAAPDSSQDVLLNLAIQIPIVVAFVFFALKLIGLFVAYLGKRDQDFAKEREDQDARTRNFLAEQEAKNRIFLAEQSELNRRFLSEQREGYTAVLNSISEQVKSTTARIESQIDLLKNHDQKATVLLQTSIDKLQTLIETLEPRRGTP